MLNKFLNNFLNQFCNQICLQIKKKTFFFTNWRFVNIQNFSNIFSTFIEDRAEPTPRR
mgnify:CR=1 FL=1